MAAASYSSQVQQRVEEANKSPTPENTDDVANPTTPEHSDDVERLDEAIQNLPPELREKIYKEYVATMQKERGAMGWKKVHEALEQIDTDRKCLECGIRRLVGISPLCWVCDVTEEECHMCPVCGMCVQCVEYCVCTNCGSYFQYV